MWNDTDPRLHEACLARETAWGRRAIDEIERRQKAEQWMGFWRGLSLSLLTGEAVRLIVWWFS